MNKVFTLVGFLFVMIAGQPLYAMAYFAAVGAICISIETLKETKE